MARTCARGASSKVARRSRSRSRSCCSRAARSVRHARVRGWREDPRSGGRAAAGASAVQDRDPGALLEPGAVRQPDRRRRARRAGIFRPRHRDADAAQAAFLAALPQRPTRSIRGAHPAGAKRAAGRAGRMAQRGAGSGERLRRRAPNGSRCAQDAAAFLAPHFVEQVLAQAGGDRPRRIETTLDAALQRTVEGIIAPQRRVAGRASARRTSRSSSSTTHAANGWRGRGRATTATLSTAARSTASLLPRQPGSALKPFTYALAFERGIDPGTVLPDIPSQFPTAEAGVLYSPRNYDGRYRGPLLARAALAGSENVPAVALASRVGVPARRALPAPGGFHDARQQRGVLRPRPDARQRGSAPRRAGRGLRDVRARRRVDARRDACGRSTAARFRRTESERLVSARTAFWITDILRDAEARAYIFGRGGNLEFPFPVAVKTGTSQAYHDNWTVGYTRDVTVGVWVGNFNRTPLRDSSGVTGAGPIFHDVMMAAVEHVRGSLPHRRPGGDSRADGQRAPGRRCARCPDLPPATRVRRVSPNGCRRR